MNLVRFLLALLLLWSQPALAQSRDWVVTDAGGAAELHRSGNVQPLRRGLRLQPGDTVATGANGRASLGRGREFIVVSPRTRLTIPAPSQQQGGLTQFMQHIGRATFNIETRSAPHFGVRTPHLVAIVRGTTFTVIVDDRGCRVAVSEGRVEVTSVDGQTRHFVDPGMQATSPAPAHNTIILDRARPGENGSESSGTGDHSGTSGSHHHAADARGS